MRFIHGMEIGMQVSKEQLPIELECWLLKWGILDREDVFSMDNRVSSSKRDTTTSQGWKPSFKGEEPPY